SDNSQTIIDCFLSEAKSYDIKIITQTIVQTIEKENDFWKLETSKDVFQCKQLVVSTGSNTKIWDVLQYADHSIVTPVPSLFTFNIKDDRIKDLMGVSRSEEHTSELQSRENLVCRLLLEKK